MNLDSYLMLIHRQDRNHSCIVREVEWDPHMYSLRDIVCKMSFPQQSNIHSGKVSVLKL